MYVCMYGACACVHYAERNVATPTGCMYCLHVHPVTTIQTTSPQLTGPSSSRPPSSNAHHRWSATYAPASRAATSRCPPGPGVSRRGPCDHDVPVADGLADRAGQRSERVHPPRNRNHRQQNRKGYDGSARYRAEFAGTDRRRNKHTRGNPASRVRLAGGGWRFGKRTDARLSTVWP